MSILQQGIVPTSAGGYEIANSLRFNDDDSAYLSWTPTSAGNRKTWTWSGWVKRGNLSEGDLFGHQGTVASNYQTYIRLESDYKLSFVIYNNASYISFLKTSALFRDVSAWYHLVVAVDTTQATSTNRVKFYINGEQLTDFSSTTYPSQNFDTYINSSSHAVGIGRNAGSTNGAYFDGYLAEVNFIDGQALDPSNFGETGDYGEWKPIKYTGAYGVNGFYLDFENSGSLGADVSGNGNNWTPTNLAATDQMLDSPTNNFATLNPVSYYPGIVSGTLADNTLSEGNTKLTTTIPSGVAWTPSIGSLVVSSGKWYWEYTFISGYGSIAGVINATSADRSLSYATGYRSTNGQKYVDNSASAYGDTLATGDIIGVALDADADTVTFYRNNTSQGSISLGANTKASGSYLPVIYMGDTAAFSINLGQDSSFAGNKTAQGNSDGNGYGDFYYTPPSGFLALCTQNLPDPTVIPSEHFNTVLYTGTGASDNSITGVGFTPDFVWLKDRSTVVNHQLMDRLRSNGTVRLRSDVTDAEDQYGLKSLDSDGFTTDGAIHNTSSSAYVSWNWKANGSGVSNTNGSITSTVSANQDAGFSIVSYTGTGSNATVGHGLSSTPEIIFYKNRDSALAWFVQMDGSIIDSLLGGTEAYKFRLLLNSDGALTFDTGHFSANPTSSTFAIGTSGYTNASSANHLAYCFHSVDGYSKVGSYTGNGSTDGTFVYTGFRPAYVMIKRTDSAGDWYIWDAVRNEYNLVTRNLVPNKSNAEFVGTSNYTLDFTSNGFKHRGSGSDVNASGGSHIYYAVAENPFKHTNAR